MRNVKEFIRHPMKGFVMNYKSDPLCHCPCRLIYLTSVYLSLPDMSFGEKFIDMMDDHVVIAVLIILIPLWYFLRALEAKYPGNRGTYPGFP